MKRERPKFKIICIMGRGHSGSINKWCKELYPEKVARIEAACSPAFEDGFYEPSQQNHTLQSVLRNRTMDTSMAILASLYHQFVMAKNRRTLRFID